MPRYNLFHVIIYGSLCIILICIPNIQGHINKDNIRLFIYSNEIVVTKSSKLLAYLVPKL